MLASKGVLVDEIHRLTEMRDPKLLFSLLLVKPMELLTELLSLVLVKMGSRFGWMRGLFGSWIAFKMIVLLHIPFLILW